MISSPSLRLQGQRSPVRAPRPREARHGNLHRGQQDPPSPAAPPSGAHRGRLPHRLRRDADRRDARRPPGTTPALDRPSYLTAGASRRPVCTARPPQSPQPRPIITGPPRPHPPPQPNGPPSIEPSSSPPKRPVPAPTPPPNQ